MIEFHFRDNASGACVQTLSVSHADKTDAEVLADLQAHAADRTVIDITDGKHVCAVIAPSAAAILATTKSTRLAALRAKGWANLTTAEQAEATALRFDLGL